jgi:hypothetical protein
VSARPQSPERFIPVWMSVGEVQHLIDCLHELADTDAGVPELPMEILTFALETEPRRTAEQMEHERGL